MLVVLVDDDRMSLDALSAMLRGVGCEVQAYQDSVSALMRLPANADLVISDVGMPGVDGFSLAEGVAMRFGICPPRTLLVSGDPPVGKMDDYPPSKVIGIVSKPVQYEELGRIVGFLAQTRKCCPGVKAPLCPYAYCHEQGWGQEADAECSGACETVEYARCQHYDEVCGRNLRLWVARDERLAAETG